ncbi:MAG: hypothetical protein GY944_02445, partial [bacterium]|nr:hypothetical protein [bacterium]
MNLRRSLLLSGLVVALACGSDAPPRLVPSGDDGSGHTAPSEATLRKNAAVLEALPFADESDFERARRGFVAARKQRVIADAGGNVGWNLDDYAFETGDTP